MGCFWRGWLGFDDPEKQDGGKRKQDKEREAYEVNEADGDDDAQYEEGIDGSVRVFARISKEGRDLGCKFFDILPTLANDTTESEIEALIFLQKYSYHVQPKTNYNLTCGAAFWTFRVSVVDLK